MSFQNQEFGFRGTKRVALKEPLFVYIEWGGINPSNSDILKEVIEEVDMELFPNSKKSIKDTSFLTFLQAETLFSEIKENFDNFVFNGLALVSQASKNKLLTGRVSFGEGPRISPFVLDNDYQNLVLTFIAATRKDTRFAQYSFDDLATYFCTIEPNLMDCYKDSLGLSVSELPIYPPKNTIPGELDREGSGKTSAEQTPPLSMQVNKGGAYAGDIKPLEKRVHVGVVLATLGVVLGLFGLITTFMNSNTNREQNQKVDYLYEQVTRLENIQSNGYAADVVGKYFISHYFTGKKENLTPFLSDGNAKFTQPEQQTVTSSILKNLSLADDGATYSLTYVLGLKGKDNSTTLETITFDMKQDEHTVYGWKVVSEPLREPYASSTKK